MDDVIIPAAGHDTVEYELAAAEAALGRGEADRAMRIWAGLRERFPAHPAAWRRPAEVLADAGDFDAADALLRAGLPLVARDDAVLLASAFARLAARRPDVEEAVQRWDAVRTDFPAHPVGWVGAVESLRDAARVDAAEAMLDLLVERFPGEPTIPILRASLADARHDWPTSVALWELTRNSLPQHPLGFIKGARALAESGDVDAADGLLAEAVARFPENTELATQWAELAAHAGRWTDAAERWAALRRRQPANVQAYVGGAIALREVGQPAAADALLEEAIARFPNRSDLHMHAAPQVDVQLALARTLLVQGRLDEAEAILRPIMQSSPQRFEAFMEYAAIASRRHDWEEALRRWRDAHRRFPKISDLGARVFEAELRVVETTAAEPLREPIVPPVPSAIQQSVDAADQPPAARPSTVAAAVPPTAAAVSPALASAVPSAVATNVIPAAGPAAMAPQPSASTAGSTDAAAPPMRTVITQFESLGGTLHGCEFGLIQRHFGAEPLGLLRWTEMAPQNVIDALEAGFEGVGLPENTELGVHQTPDGPEYFTTDKRFLMSMHTFIKETEISHDKMFAQCCRRLRFLRDKLVADLRSGAKIFVYKITWRVMTADEIARMHAALRRYGDATLLYVQRALPDKPHGTVELVKPGLMMGYIDRFSASPTGENLPPAPESWSLVCRRALALWDNPALRPDAGGTPGATASAADQAAAPEARPDEPEVQAESLDTLGVLAATDKSSVRWDYLRQYEELFRPWRDVAFNLIEIGVAGGNSIRTWGRFFTRATIVGIDIDERALRIVADRVVIEIGSQADAAFLDGLCDRYPPAIVIDDGSHEAEHIMFTFRQMFPRLAPGGWYVIEDLNITGGMDQVPLTPHDYFSRTAQAIMHRRPGDHPEPAILEQIDRIDFAPGIVFIRKADPARRQQRLAQAAALVQQTVNPNNFHWLADALMNELANLPAAEAAARRAVELRPDVAVYHLGLAAVLERQGDLAAATATAREAAAVEPENFMCHLRVAELLGRSGEAAEATLALRRSAETAPATLRGHIEGELRRILAGQ
jgi:tetratricopeptide (TPR) repeat protein